MPDHNVAIFQRLILQTHIGVRTVDGVHPARFFAIGKLAKGISTEAGGCIDCADVVVICANGSQPRFLHGFCIEVINRSVLLQCICRGGHPCDIFGQIAVSRQVNILRCFQSADETERDFNISRLHSVEISNSLRVNVRDALAGFRSVHICLCLLENVCELLLRRCAVLLVLVVQQLVVMLLQQLVLICPFLLQNLAIVFFRVGQCLIIRDLVLILVRKVVVGDAGFSDSIIAAFTDRSDLVNQVDDFLHACVFTLHDVGHIIQTVTVPCITVIRNKRVGRLFGCHLIDRTICAAVRIDLDVQESTGRFVCIAQEVGQNADALILEVCIRPCVNAQRRQRDNDLSSGFGASIIAAQPILRGQPSNSIIHGILGICIGSVVRSQRLHDHCRRVNIIARMIAVDIPCAVGMLVGVKRLDPRFTRRIAGRILVVAAGIQCNQCKSCTIISLFGDSVSTA